jgi:two-component system, chemotaxis family, protein-glutamate methylesterase/glutaminase
MLKESGKIRVVIIDDSYFMRKLLKDILECDSEIRVVGTAENGEYGLRMIKELEPDVVTLDYNMPGWNGLETLRRIMEQHPVPVVMLSAYTRTDADITLQSLEDGALDYILKPSGEISWDIDKTKNSIIEKVKCASEADVEKLSTLQNKRAERLSIANRTPLEDTIIAIGASTGGPPIVESILRQLPKDMPSSILIVQHMPKIFTELFAKRLDDECSITVKEAMHGEVIEMGVAYVAPGGWHMEVERRYVYDRERGVIVLSKKLPVNNYRPSIDVLMESVAFAYKSNAIGLILTGAGDDGSVGISRIAEEGGKTIAQDEATSVIFGMPGSAIKAGGVKEVLPSFMISARLLQMITK